MACGRTIGNPGRRRHLRRFGKTAAAFAFLTLVFAAPLAAQPVPAVPAQPAPAPLKTAVTAKVADGYARLVFTASQYLDASARVAGNVLIISFRQPVDLTVDRIAEQASDFIGTARRDPDGTAVRVALAQAVTVHTMSAGEKFFVDLLPQSWTGLPPGLPQDVVDELASRARQVDMLMQREKQRNEQQKVAPIRVHVATEPTFTRYVFDVSDHIGVSADRDKNRLVLNFDTPLTFDLGEADAALPDGVQEITSELEDDSSLVRFILASNIDVRTFRDEQGYVVDVVSTNAAGAAASPNGPATKPAAGSEAGQSDDAAAKLASAAAKLRTAVEGPATPKPAQMAPAQSSPPPVAAAAPPAPPAPAPQVAAAPAAQSNPAPAAAQNPAPSSPPVAAAAPASPPEPAAVTTPTAQPTPVPGAAATPSPPPQPVAQAAPSVATPAQTPPPATQATPPAPPSPVAQATPPVPVPAPPPSSPPPSAAQTPPATPDAAATTPRPAPAPADKTSENVPAHPAAHARDPNKIAVDLTQQGGMLKVSFPFPSLVAAAVFHRADSLWIVFDSKAGIDLSSLDGEPSRTIRGYAVRHEDDADVIQLTLDRPHLVSASASGAIWTIAIGDTVTDPTRAVDVTRNLVGPNRSTISIGLDKPQHVHRLVDPEAGDVLDVVTALPPARGFIDEQDFIEFHALASTEGVVIEPIADDLALDLAPDKVVITRPAGLTLSTSLQTLLHGSGLRPMMFDSQVWGFDRQASYSERQSHLIAAAAGAPENKRLAPRIDLARFYLARGMYPEAKGVLDVALSDERNASEAISAVVLRSVAEVMMNRPSAALKDLSDPGVGDQHDAALWRALACARQGNWAQAREIFKTVDAAVATLPVELQRDALKDEMRSSIEVGDYNGASSDLNDFETIGIPHDMEPVLAVLMGRLAEGLGRNEDALTAYRTAADSWDRPAAAQGLLRETELRYRLGDLKRDDVLSQLESLTTLWRGDETEIEALKVLAHLYTEEGRYRDAFYVMRSAMAARPDSQLTRQIQDEAAQTFDALFLTAKGDAMPAVDALALFYDFRELTPVGSRGDEMIRRLAERLVSVDLLDQASDLLQYQVDHRLEGAGRTEVATRLAAIYLMNRKPDRALAALRASRSPDLAQSLREQRLLLEARALSDLSRHDLALEVVADIPGPTAIRLRSDILWAGRRWREAAEQIELMYGDRYKDFAPLTDVERQDILRAEIGFALAEDSLGLGRFRDKYAAKMAGTPDARAFDIVSAPLGTSGDEFGAIAHAAGSVDTLEGFLRDMKAHYPDSTALSGPGASPPAAAPPPPARGTSASATPPETQPATPPPAAAGKTASN
jgi:tetratricopeptide (TPR) repeat protein